MYVRRFVRPLPPPEVEGTTDNPDQTTAATATDRIQSAINALEWHDPQPLEVRSMAGPTGEANQLALWPRGLVLCLGPTAQEAALQAGTARRMGCAALMVAPGVDPELGVDGFLEREALASLSGFSVVALWGEAADQSRARQALAQREGALIPLVTQDDLDTYCVQERHTCIDTTAAGGNASLLATSDD